METYLIKEEKTAIFDTVWAPFAEEYVQNLSQEIELNKIDYVIAPHAEIDHSGALPLLMSQIPDTPIYCTKNGEKSLKGHYHQDWNFNVVKTGDRLSLGKKELIFIEAPMLGIKEAFGNDFLEAKNYNADTFIARGIHWWR